jgi:hypothetical protein
MSKKIVEDENIIKPVEIQLEKEKKPSIGDEKTEKRTIFEPKTRFEPKFEP